MAIDRPKWGIIHKTIAPIMKQPECHSEVVDEGLYGMIVQLKKDVKGGWYHIQTHYNYSGFLHESYMIIDPARVENWRNRKHAIINHGLVDVMAGPTYKTYRLEMITRGAVVHETGKIVSGWSEIELADGQYGWVRHSFIGELKETNDLKEEQQLRKTLVATARTYLDVQYRWGGKSPMGIDCSGLCSITYLLNGITIYRDAILKDTYMKKINQSEMGPGDLIFFPGHVAMYIGEDKYIHSSADGNGVKINSLNPMHKDYKEDLHKTITGIGTVF